METSINCMKKKQDELEKLRNVEGVMHIDVVFAEFEDLLPDEEAKALPLTGERVSRSDEPRIEMEQNEWS